MKRATDSAAKCDQEIQVNSTAAERASPLGQRDKLARLCMRRQMTSGCRECPYAWEITHSPQDSSQPFSLVQDILLTRQNHKER